MSNRTLGLVALGALLGCERARSPVAVEADARWMLEYYVTALQDQYRAVHGRYAAHYTSLFDPGRPPTSQALGQARVGIEIQVAAGDHSGWSASATHRAYPGCSCILTVGTPAHQLGLPRDDAPGARLGPPGVVICRGFGVGTS
jgi:hypothetical protein